MIEKKENLGSAIQKNEKALSDFYSQMEKLKQDFTEQVVVFASEWYQKTVKAYITKYPEITLNMKEESIIKMKQKIKKLVQDASDITQKELSKSTYWWHLNPNLSDSFDMYTQISEKYPLVLDYAVRRILGHLGVILEEFKFNITTNANSGSYSEFWFDNQPIAETVPFYPHLLKWSIDMQYTIQQYNMLFVQALELFKETRNLKDQKKKLLASERWDSL